VHCRRPHFPSLPYLTFIALTSDRAGKLIDLGETLLATSIAPTNNANLGKFVTAALGIGTQAATRHLIACLMGARYWSFVGGAMNYGKLRVSERTYGSPCVVLVINDNPYGLMIALSYMCRTYP
jgi:hypothetical protein